MKWSWTLGRVAGIELRLHATFLILLAWLAIIDYRVSGTATGALVGVLFTLALFASVVLHEMGHALVARRYGIPTRNITLLPIGGVARLDRMPDKPRQELGISLAGPAVTVIIALVLAGSLRLVGLPVVVAGDAVAHRTPGAFFAELLWANVVLLVFNLLPAFPLDGGRVLRAGLALRMGYERATAVATRVGRGFALVFAAVGLLYNPLLVVIALFIWMSAVAESAELLQRSALTGIKVDRLMIRDAKVLAADDTLSEAQRLVLTGFQQDFPVLDADQVVGVLTRASLLEGLAHRGAGSRVGASMETTFRTATPEELVTDVLARLRDGRCRAVPVVAGGRLLGLLTTDNIAEFVLIEAALHPTPAAPGHPPVARAEHSQNHLTGALS